MGFIVRCPLTGIPCAKSITVEEKTFFLAEAEKPEDNRRRRGQAISKALSARYIVRSALDEKGVNAFTDKICEMIQTCAYGIADITERNPNVILELGMMLALGKPAVILQKRGEEGLNLPSDLNAIEVIPFDEYIDIIDPLHEIAKKLPPPVTPTSPMQDLDKILPPKLAQEVSKELGKVVQEFRQRIQQAKLDTTLPAEEKNTVSPELSEKIAHLEEMLQEMDKLGLATDAQTAFYRGNFYFEQGKYEKALAYYDRALQITPDNATILSNRGGAYFKLERYKEALADFNRSLEFRPDNPGTLNNRGGTYFKLERYKEAMTDCNRSLELRPDHPGTLNNRGSVYAKLKRYKKALADYNRSLELKPDDPDTFFNLACLFSFQNKVDDALIYLEKSIKGDEENRQMARDDKDKDFDNIRDDPRFKKLIETS